MTIHLLWNRYFITSQGATNYVCYFPTVKIQKSHIFKRGGSQCDINFEENKKVGRKQLPSATICNMLRQHPAVIATFKLPVMNKRQAITVPIYPDIPSRPQEWGRERDGGAGVGRGKKKKIDMVTLIILSVCCRARNPVWQTR